MPNALVEVGPLCDCGCGEHLPIGSTRAYKRGHKSRENRRVADEMENNIRNGVFDGYEFRTQMPYNTEPIDPFAFNPVEDSNGWETIADAAANTPDDPDGANFWETQTKEQNPWSDYKEFKLPRGVQKDVEGKVAFMLLTTGNAVSLIDGVCGGAILDNAAQVAKSLTPILCQSKGVVEWFTKTSNFMLYVNLAMALAPIVMAIASHHLPGGKEPEFTVTNGQMNIDPNMYGVQ